MKARFALAATMALSMVASTATAEESSLSARYDFFVGGFRIAEIALTARADGEGYEAASNVATRGVLEVLIRGRSSTTATGRRDAQGRLRPVSYAADYASRRGEQSTRIGYEDANPARVTFDPVPDPEDSAEHAKPRDQRGSLDPLSATVAALLPADGANLCNRTIPIFDGKRRFDIVFLAPDPGRESAPAPEWNAPLTRCLGIYERIDGFGEQTDDDQRYFPFDIWFEKDGSGFHRAVRLAGSTKLGFAIGNLRR